MQTLDNIHRTGNLYIEEKSIASLPKRELTWTVLQAGISYGLILSPLFEAGDYLVPTIALGITAAATKLRSIWSLPLAALVPATAYAAHLAGLPEASLAGLAAGAAVGILTNKSKWRTLNTALAGAALLPIGQYAATQILTSIPGSIGLVTSLLVSALITAQIILVSDTDFKPIIRIPSARVIRATLEKPYQESCLKALDHDQAIQKDAPDKVTRDGLGEIAAWVYHLALSMQTQDKELNSQSDEELSQRLISAKDAIENAGDNYIKERRQATLKHLETMVRHRQSLRLERERTESLSDYALATLEEARAGLALSRQLPGAHTPEGINEVLQRLRSHTSEESAKRQTARELA